MSIASLRRHHLEIVEVVRRIDAALDPAKMPTAAGEIRGLLSTLMSKLSFHLAMEDNWLYPNLQKREDPKVREIGLRFSREMAGVKPGVDAFARKWSEAEIRSNAATFCTEARQLFATLGERMTREDAELYPLLG